MITYAPPATMPLIRTPGVQHRSEDYGLDAETIGLLWRMEERHFWHRARNAWILRALRQVGLLPPTSVLEVGCGSGAVAWSLHAAGYDVTGIDTAEPLVIKAHERCAGATFVVGDVASFSSPKAFAAVAFFDVLEHLSDPESMIRSCRHLVAPGSILIATVPAQAALHTVVDDLSGHKRRYERGELAALFSRVGLTDVQERGIFRLTSVFQKRLRRDDSSRDASSLSEEERRAIWRRNFRIPPAIINGGFEALCALERTVGFDLARDRAGASLIATGRFPENTVSA